VAVDLTTQHAAREADFIRRAEREFLAFTVYTYGPDYTVNWHHRRQAKFLQAWAEGKIPRLMIHEPPRHGKTEQASIRLPAWILGRRPDADIIGTSRDSDFARKVSRQVKRVIQSPEYRRIFARYDLQDTENPDNYQNVEIPDNRVASDEREQWRNTAKEWEIVTHGGSYEAYGAGQGISGAGGDFLLVEDPYPSREKAQSSTFRQKVNTWYTDDLYERRENDAKILIIHTRWHQNDLAGFLERRSGEIPETDDWVVLKMPGLRLNDEPIAYATGDLDIREVAQKVGVDIEDPRSTGEALWPDKRDEDDFEADRQTNPRKFWSLGQQQPQPDGGAVFTEAQMDAESNIWDSLPGAVGEWLLVCDPKGGSKDPDSSQCVIQLWFQPDHSPANIYLVDQAKGIWSQSETEDKIRELTETAVWRLADQIAIEDKGDGPGIKGHIEDEIPGVYLIEPWAGKEQRARDVQRFFRSGNVHRPRRDHRDWVSEWRAQMTTFPGAERDDQVDTTVYAVDQLLGKRGQTDQDDDSDEDVNPLSWRPSMTGI